ncbi:MAG: FMN-binding protein [Defluviitaleaceae bacterium]|nr:FMN-binding protein [Defluviitaleaceae bacterium]
MKKKFLGLFAIVLAIVVFAACSRPVDPVDSDVEEMGNNTYRVEVNGWGSSGTNTFWVYVQFSPDYSELISIESDFAGETADFMPAVRDIRDLIVYHQTLEGIHTNTGSTTTANALVSAVEMIFEYVSFEAGEAVDLEPVENPLRPEFDRTSQFSASAIGWQMDGGARTSGFGPGNENVYVYVVMNDDNTVIEEILVNFNYESASFVNMMHPMIVDQIVANQGTEGIEVWTGATGTTEAVIAAVNTVLDRIGFVPPAEDVTEPDDGDVTEPDDEDPTEAPAEDTTTVAGGTEPTTTAPTVAAGIFNPGSQTATSTQSYANNPNNEGGLSPANIVLTVTFDSNAITAVSVVSQGESSDYWSQAWGRLSAQFVGRDSTAGINTVSGATYTSRGIIDAVNQAITAARR